MEFPLAFATAIEIALGQLLALDDNAPTRLAPLRGKVIGLRVKGLGASLYFLVGEQQVEVNRFFDGQTDVCIQATPADLLSLIGSAEALQRGQIHIEGDLRVAKHFQALLRELEIDWEEQLSAVAGDVVAFRAGQLFGQLSSAFRRQHQRQRAQLSDYLHTESEQLVHRLAFLDFSDQVDELRDQHQRLNARLDALENRAQAPARD